MNEEEVISKISKLSPEELIVHYRAAKGMNRIANVMGIAFVFGIMVYYSTAVLLFGGFAVYLVAKVSAGIGKTIKIIEDRIVALSDK